MNRIRGALLLITCGTAAFALQTSVRADENNFSFDALKFTAPAPDAHRWSVELLGTAMGDLNGRQVVMGGVTGGLGYYIWDNFAINLDVTGYGFNEGQPSGAAAGVTLGVRHHLFSYKKATMFVDLSGGEIQASSELPEGGTHLNDTLQVGLGVARPIAPNLSVMAGLRYFHISNARSEGADRNPSINSIQGVFGLVWRL